jgi:hypothetical protein
MAERSSKNWKASEEYYYESIAALDGMEVPRTLGMRKMEFGLMLKESGDVVRARKMLEESKQLLTSVGSNDMGSLVERELEGLSSPEI